MKLHTDRIDIERSNVGTETEFKIKTTAKAFDILSSGLYTDNILAIVRELSCNAYDAHVAAGKADTPFEIHLPNRLEPFFSVKDLGTGLSDDHVMTLYTTYFDSTKTGSNDFIGALGLGSKSPFSYVKSFEVISRYDGYRRVYTVFINEDGVPTIARMGDAVSTDEPNGLEVKLTVDPSDAYKFESKTASALRWFPVKPKVVGVPSFKYNDPPKTDVQGDGWYIYKGDYYKSGNMTAIQGNVEYRVDIDQIDDIEESVKTFLRRTNVIAFFEIGELEVAASREEIRYDNRTKVAIAAKISNIHRTALQDIETEAQTYTSLWDMTIAMNKKGQDIFRDVSDFRSFVAVSDVEYLQRYSKGKGHVRIDCDVDAHDLYEYRWGSNYGSGNNLTRSAGKAFQPQNGTYVFVNDLKTGGIKRLSNWLREKQGQKLIVITERKDPQKYTTKLFQGMHQKVGTPLTRRAINKELKTIIEELGNPQVRYVSTDTDPVRAVSSGTRSKSIFRYEEWKQNSYREDTVVFERPAQFDFDAGGLYFDLERKTKIKFRGTLVSWSPRYVGENLENIVDVINAYQGLDEDDSWDAETQLFGVGSSDIKRFKKADNWFNVFDLLLEAVAAHKASAEASVKWDATKDYFDLKVAVGNQMFMNGVNGLDPNSKFRKLVEGYRAGFVAKHSVTLPHTGLVREFDQFFGDHQLKTLDNTPYVEDDTNLVESYPMLRYIGGFNEYKIKTDKVAMAEMFEYVKLIDRS